MIRRNARLRREYLYRKGLEGKEKDVYEKKRQVREALKEGKPIPTELKSDYYDLKKKIDLDDVATEDRKDILDDEYAKVGTYDPVILLTTSRSPSRRLVQFVKELKLVFPNAQRINRGGVVTKDIVEGCRSGDTTDIVIVHEHRGQPDGLVISHLPYGPTAYFGLSNCVLRHDLPDKISTMSEAYPHLIFDNFQSKLGGRVKTILQSLFPVPKDDSRRVITMSNRDDVIAFRHHTYKKLGGKDVELSEVGPRFDLKLYQIKLGTIDMDEAESEWVLRPYMNTAKKRRIL